jgi:hypothetical protein
MAAGSQFFLKFSLAPKVPLGAHFREAALRGDQCPEPIPTDASIADAKRSFAELRSQAELGHEEIGSQSVDDTRQTALDRPKGDYALMDS